MNIKDQLSKKIEDASKKMEATDQEGVRNFV